MIILILLLGHVSNSSPGLPLLVILEAYFAVTVFDASYQTSLVFVVNGRVKHRLLLPRELVESHRNSLPKYPVPFSPPGLSSAGFRNPDLGTRRFHVTKSGNEGW
jgi:hypothetical protein